MNDEQYNDIIASLEEIRALQRKMTNDIQRIAAYIDTINDKYDAGDKSGGHGFK